MTIANTSTGRIADDLLFGAKAIADEIGVKPAVVYDLHEQGKLPFVKVFRGRLTALRSVVRAEMHKMLTA
jgi:hypothetical protein